MKNILRILFSFAFFFLTSNLSYSQDYNNQQPVFPQSPAGEFGQSQGSGSSTTNVLGNLPVPYETKKVQSDLGQAYDLNIDMFSSQLSISEIKDFYKQELSRLGWQPVDMSKMFLSSNLNQMNVPAQTEEVAKNSLTYKKRKSVLVVAFYPYQGDSSVIYSLTVKQVQ